LNALQTALGGQPLTPTVVQQNYQKLLDNDFALAKQLACTPCASAGFALVRPVLPQEFLDIIDSFVGTQCGQDFTCTFLILLQCSLNTIVVTSFFIRILPLYIVLTTFSTALPTGSISVVTGTQAALAIQATASATSGATHLGSHQSMILGSTVGILGLGLALL
jgi:hypothetical protein